MKHIIRSCTLSLIGLSAFAIFPIIFITWLQAGPGPDGNIYQFFHDWIIDKDRLAKFDIPFSLVAKSLFNLVTNMNISLLVLMPDGPDLGSSLPLRSCRQLSFSVDS